MRRMLLRLTLMAATAAVASAVPTDDLDGWYPCEIGSASTLPSPHGSRKTLTDAQCAIFRAPLCYAGVCNDPANRTLDVFVRRLVATRRRSTPDRTPSILLVQSGPTTTASLDYEAAMQSISASLDGDVDVYSLDRRGTGRSAKLDCVAAQAQSPNSPGGVAISPEEAASCADALASQYPQRLSAFSVTSAALDVRYFLDHFLNGSGPTFVYGAGVSSPIVERLMHVTSETSGRPITGYILDGVATTSGALTTDFPYQSKADEAFDAVGQEFLGLCGSDTDCSKHFPGAALASALRSLVKQLDAPRSVCAFALDTQLAKVFAYDPSDYLPAQPFRWVMGELLRRATLRQFIPVITYRIGRCSVDDTKVLNHFFETLATRLHASTQPRATLLSKLVSFSEFWELPTPSTETMEMRFRKASLTLGAYSVLSYCAFTKANATACEPYSEFTTYTASPIAYERDQFWNVPATPPNNASVLVLSGTLDPVTPHKYAEALVTALNTTHKKLVAFEHATHGALWTTATDHNAPTCGVAILASYVRNNGDLAKTDTSCVAKVPTLSFAIEPSSVTTWLSATEAYDGMFVRGGSITSGGTSGGLTSPLASPYKLAFIGLCVLLGLALIVACVLLAKWRRASRRDRRLTVCVDDPAYDACRESPTTDTSTSR